MATIQIITSTPEQLIGEAAKTCYNTKLIVDGGRDITHQLVHKQKHLAVLRFAFVVIEIKHLSIAAQNQLVRSKHLDFMVQSKRYVSNKKGNFKFIMPNGLSNKQQDYMQIHWDESIDTYNQLINDGVKPEDARAILPANTSTTMLVAGNLQAWSDMLRLRVSYHAQLEIRLIAIEIWGLLITYYPQVFTDMKYDNKSYTEWTNET